MKICARNVVIMVLTALVVSCTEHRNRTPASEVVRPATKPLPGYAEKWPSACKKIKDRLRSPGAALLSQPLPPRAAETDPWTVSLGPFSVSLPSDTYVVKASRSGGSGDSISVLLQAGRRMILLIKDPPSQPIKDVFAQVGQLAPGKEEQKHTLKLFGKLPTIHDLAKIGYQHTPAELSCSASKADQEVPIAISLILKTTGQWAEKVFAIEGVPGLVFFGNQGKRCTVDARPHDSAASFFITYTTPDRKECEDTLRRFRLVKGGKDRGPPWLEALGKALRSPSDLASWESLSKALAKAHAPGESLSSVEKIIEQLRRPK